MAQRTIKSKILWLTLGITVFCSVSFVLIANYAMNKEGRYSLNQSIKLGEESAAKSRTALASQAEQYLTKLVGIQAESSNDFFRSITVQVEILQQFCKFLWSNQALKTDFAACPLPDERRLSYLYRLAPGVEQAAVQNEFQRLLCMGRVFKPYLFNNENLDSFFLGTETGINILWPDTQGTTDGTYDPRSRPWYLDAVKRNGIGWTDIFRGASTSNLMVACSGPARDDTGSLRGVVGVTVTLDEMLEVISNQVKDIGYAFLLDEQGAVIAFPALEQAEKVMDYEQDNLLKTDDPALREIVRSMVKGQSGFSEVRLKSGDKFLGYAPIRETGWSLAVVISVDQVLKAARETEKNIMDYTAKTRERLKDIMLEMQTIVALMFGVILLVAVFIAIKMSNKISKPILDLRQGVQKVGQGDLDHSLDIRTGDEIQALAEAFNRMTGDLKQYIHNLQVTTAAKEKIESELQVANKIQASMLPRIFPPFPQRREFDIWAGMEPAREVGGDLFDFFFINETTFCFVIGDVSGKGVPASLFMVIAKTLLKNEALRNASPEQILHNVNNALCEDNDECMFVTGFICIIDLETGLAQFANAGHNPPLFSRSEAMDFAYLEMESGFILGGMEEFTFNRETLQMQPGDVLLLYTDGVTEAMDIQGRQYSPERLQKIVSEAETSDVHELIALVQEDVRKFAGQAEQSDDITMLAFRFNQTTGA